MAAMVAPVIAPMTVACAAEMQPHVGSGIVPTVPAMVVSVARVRTGLQ